MNYIFPRSLRTNWWTLKMITCKKNLDLWPMTSKLNSVCEVVKVHVHAKYHQAECSGSWIRWKIRKTGPVTLTFDHEILRVSCGCQGTCSCKISLSYMQHREKNSKENITHHARTVVNAGYHITSLAEVNIYIHTLYTLKSADSSLQYNSGSRSFKLAACCTYTPDTTTTKFTTCTQKSCAYLWMYKTNIPLTKSALSW